MIFLKDLVREGSYATHILILFVFKHIISECLRYS